ncbi:hypothetical protein [Streptomyces sp. AD55]|uniref:hypothetical protein n=1 Tax=Streptomyces sp. AD55 TaxID=3242895 RepID=UPI003526DAF0
MIAETVCSAVSAAGLGIAAITAYRRRFLAAVRVAAYALVPVGLVMTGVVKWLAGTAFSPTAWAGFAVLGLAWLLFMITRAVERRRGGSRGRRGETGAAAEPGPVAPGASRPSLGSSASRPAAGASGSSAAPAKGEDDFSDIEAILKKHGI